MYTFVVYNIQSPICICNLSFVIAPFLICILSFVIAPFVICSLFISCPFIDMLYTIYMAHETWEILFICAINNNIFFFCKKHNRKCVLPPCVTCFKHATFYTAVKFTSSLKLGERWNMKLSFSCFRRQKWEWNFAHTKRCFLLARKSFQKLPTVFIKQT